MSHILSKKYNDNKIYIIKNYIEKIELKFRSFQYGTGRETKNNIMVVPTADGTYKMDFTNLPYDSAADSSHHYLIIGIDIQKMGLDINNNYFIEIDEIKVHNSGTYGYANESVSISGIVSYGLNNEGPFYNISGNIVYDFSIAWFGQGSTFNLVSTVGSYIKIKNFYYTKN